MRTLALTLLLLAAPALASDGALEINQICALQTGCFPGDTAGFPVLVTQPGSYVMTGDLTPTPGAIGIEVEADDVAIDLHGFAIRGGLSCGPGSCTGSGPSGGIAVPASPVTNGRRCTVRNGTIRGINGIAIELRDGALVDEVVVSDAFTYGISLGPNSLATRNRITAVGRSGLLLGTGSGYSDNVIAGTGLFFTTGSVSGGKPTGGNVCDDGRCPAGRRFYLTPTGATGDQALTHCATGFHMASLWDLKHGANLVYDATRGYIWPGTDQLPGPPAYRAGWARTGVSGGGTSAGIASCSAWTDTAGNGTIALYQGASAQPPGVFEVDAFPCNVAYGVWCIEE